jgi:hypothetical protein
MKKLTCLCFCFWTFFAVYAQGTKRPTREPSTTRYLKDLYQYVKDKVRRNQYYMNEYVINAQSLPWKDKTMKHQSFLFYYSYSGDKKPILRLAVCVQKQDKIEKRTEFMFDQDGNVSYCYEKQNDTNLAYRELQIFYEKGLCINLMVDKEILDIKDSAPYQTQIDNYKEVGKTTYSKFFQDQLLAEK